MLGQGVFPMEEEEAATMFLPNGKQQLALEVPAKYQSICPLNALGKLFEQLIMRRLENELDERNALSEGTI